jgi:hypothetical protein
MGAKLLQVSLRVGKYFIQHLREQQLFAMPPKKKNTPSWVASSPAPAKVKVPHVKELNKFTSSDFKQPKICPTWVGGTEIFPVPPFSRQVGRSFLRRFPANFYEFRINIYSPQRSAYESVLHGCPAVPGYSGSHLATASA